jgi:DNA (cytosine-5)-methyltransferase 1
VTAPQVTELFAGIGFSEVLRGLGLRGEGLEMDPATCATRRGAKHATRECDVTRHPTEPFTGTEGLIGGPPCPPFGKSGLKKGIGDLPLVHQAIEDLARGRDTRDRHGAGCQDPRSILTAEPVRWLYDLRPVWVVLEQVPAVLPVWRHVAEILRGWGYSAVTGVLHAEQHGAGQRRPRALLMANRTREVTLPAPTHGPGLPPPVAMADVIGWGYTLRPSPAVTGGGVYTGGAEPFGNGSRQAMRRAKDAVDKDGRPLWRPRAGTDSLRPTVRECALLQGFRPDLVFHGKSGQQYLQVGNAVPEVLARAAVCAASGVLEREQARAA